MIGYGAPRASEEEGETLRFGNDENDLLTFVVDEEEITDKPHFGNEVVRIAVVEPR